MDGRSFVSDIKASESCFSRSANTASVHNPTSPPSINSASAANEQDTHDVKKTRRDTSASIAKPARSLKPRRVMTVRFFRSAMWSGFGDGGADGGGDEVVVRLANVRGRATRSGRASVRCARIEKRWAFRRVWEDERIGRGETNAEQSDGMVAL